MERAAFALSTKVLKLNASATIDEDDLDILPFDFDWSCQDDSGDLCVSQAGTALDMASFATDEVLTLPKETLPAGETHQVLNTVIGVLNGIGVRNTIGVPTWYQVRGQSY